MPYRALLQLVLLEPPAPCFQLIPQSAVVTLYEVFNGRRTLASSGKQSGQQTGMSKTAASALGLNSKADQQEPGTKVRPLHVSSRCLIAYTVSFSLDTIVATIATMII